MIKPFFFNFFLLFKFVFAFIIHYSHPCSRSLPITVEKNNIIVCLYVLVLRANTGGASCVLLQSLPVSDVHPFYTCEWRLGISKRNTPIVNKFIKTDLRFDEQEQKILTMENGSNIQPEIVTVYLHMKTINWWVFNQKVWI